MRQPRTPNYTQARWEKEVKIKRLDETWHLRLSLKRPRRYILAHFHDTVSYVAPNMVCALCYQRPPESIQMVLNLQKLKGCR